MYNQPRMTTSTPSRRDRLKAGPDLTSPASMTQTVYDIRNNGLQIPQNQPAQTQTVTAPQPVQPMANAQPKSKGAASFLARELGALADAVTFGASDKLTDKFVNYIDQATQPAYIDPQKAKTAENIAGIAGSFGPLTGAFRLGARAAAPLTRNLPNLVERGVAPIANRLGPTAGVLARSGAQTAGKAIGSALAGTVGASLYATPREISEEIRNPNEQTFKQHLGDIGHEMALGAALNPVAEGYLGTIGSLFKRRLQQNGVPEEQVNEILALPMGRVDAARLRNQVNTPDVITPEYTFGLPSPKVAEPTTARIERRVNPYREQFETLMKRATEREKAGGFTPGREDMEVEQMWAAMAGKDAPSLDELIDLAYPKPREISPNAVGNARANQQFRRAVGGDLPVKSIDERYPQGAMANAEGPITVPARAPQAQPTRAQRLNEAINSSEMPRTPVQTADEAETAQILQNASKPRVRDRVYNFLDEQEKAARKRMAARRGNLSANPLPEWGDMSIIMAAKMGKGTINLADFTEAAVKEFGESVRSKAPQLFRSAKEELRRQERRASQEGQAADTFNNSGQGDATSFENKITRGKKAERKSIIDKWERLKTQFSEDIAPINRLERNITGKIASAEDSIYKSARLFKGVPEKINHYIDNRLKPIVRNLEKAGYHSDDLGRYALAVHAKDVNAAGYKSGFTNAEIDDVIRKLGTAEMEAARKELVNINRELLDGLVDSGVISGQLRDVLNDRWKNYIPLFREMDDVTGHSSGLSEALANVASPINKLKGSEKNVIEPLENMVRSIAKNITAAERNKVASHISKLAKLDPEHKFIRKLDEGEQVQGKNVVYIKENGENVYYEVNKDVRDALLTLDKESSTWLMRFLSTPASWLRSGATLTPEFMLRNPIRDYRNARIISDSGMRFDDYAVGLASSLMGKFGKGKLYQDWVENLGGYGNIVSEDKGNFAAAQRKILTQSPTKKAINVVNTKNFLQLLRSISDITESSTKVGEYRAALRKGVSKQEAAYRSRDLMDFARAGTSIRQANKIVAFLNANIQGKSRTLRAFKNNPIRTSIRVFKHMALPTVGIHYFNKYYANDTQKQTINEAPDWQRNTFWLVAVPGTDAVARIPKPFDFAIVANVIDRSLDFWAEHDKTAFDGFGKGLIADNAIPVMVTGIQPILEGMANYSFFREGPVIPQRDQGLEFKDQYDPIRTSESAKAIAGLVDSQLGSLGGNFRSPYVIDNTIQGLFAGGGKYATDAIDAILGKTGLVERTTAPEKRLEQKPVSRSFLVDPLQGGKYTDKLYDELDKLQREKRSASINDREFKNEARYKALNDAAKKMSDIGKKIREIERSDQTAKQKREQIEPLMMERNALARSTMQEATK
jgi:hypothetical protein